MNAAHTKSPTRQYWLMKDELAIEDFQKMKRTPWTGVRNYEARNFMRDEMCIGDAVIFYHSNGNPSGAAGIARVASLPYPDFTQFDSTSQYFDPKATKEMPRWFMVDVEFVKRFPHLITREEMKKSAPLKTLQLWNRPRLSIIPLTEKEFQAIVQLSTPPKETSH